MNLKKWVHNCTFRYMDKMPIGESLSIIVIQEPSTEDALGNPDLFKRTKHKQQSIFDEAVGSYLWSHNNEITNYIELNNIKDIDGYVEEFKNANLEKIMQRVIEEHLFFKLLDEELIDEEDEEYSIEEFKQNPRLMGETLDHVLKSRSYYTYLRKYNKFFSKKFSDLLTDTKWSQFFMVKIKDVIYYRIGNMRGQGRENQKEMVVKFDKTSPTSVYSISKEGILEVKDYNEFCIVDTYYNNDIDYKRICV